MELLNTLRAMLNKPKSEQSFTDSIAVELVRAHLEAKYGEKIFLAHLRIWTEHGADMVDWRKIIIHARPIAFSSPPFHGLWLEKDLPEIKAEVMFHSGETSVYSWQFAWIGLEAQNWGDNSCEWHRSEAAELPLLTQLAKNLLAYRNGNEIKRQTGADGANPARVRRNLKTAG